MSLKEKVTPKARLNPYQPEFYTPKFGFKKGVWKLQLLDLSRLAIQPLFLKNDLSSYSQSDVSLESKFKSLNESIKKATHASYKSCSSDNSFYHQVVDDNSDDDNND